MVGDLFSIVLQAVREWTPKAEYTRESKYRDDLLRFLRKKLNYSENDVLDSPIWDSYSYGQYHLIKKEAGRSLADIGIDNKIGIELKLNLRNKSQIDRLVGQVVDYLSGYCCVIIILCGHTKQEAADVLRHNLRKINTQSTTPFGQEKIIRIVSKDKSKNPIKTKNPLALF